MSTIEIRKVSITDLDTDAIVNAANDGLWAGGGVCGAIFKAAGYEQLQAACKKIGPSGCTFPSRAGRIYCEEAFLCGRDAFPYTGEYRGRCAEHHDW